MKIDKIIFASDDSHFLDFWPTQSKICKEVLNIQPVLFHITDYDSDFYYDEYGLVKKVKKIDFIMSGALAAIGRMFFTKYFPDDVCLISDIDMLLIDKDYIYNSIKNFDDDSLVIYISDAYNTNRPEAKEYISRDYFPQNINQLYPYHLNAAKGKTFNKILDTDCSFDEYINKHKELGNKTLFWGVDECYFSQCVNNNKHNIKIEKLIRGYKSPWRCNKRIERYNFPVQLEWEGEINDQKIEGIYDFNKLKEDNILEINCPRPYLKYKEEINKVVNIVLKKVTNKMKKIALISSYCDTEEKINILKENILTLKSIGVDTLVISPISLPNDIVEISDFVFFTKENPLLNWPVRGFTFWQTHYSEDGWIKMHRNVADYGWAGLYHVKKMSQIALSYDYDIFYHIIYDLDIDNYIIETINSNETNMIHPRINPNQNDDWWDATLHFMIFDREIMQKVTDVIILEDYLKVNGVAEGEALKWTTLFPIKISKTPVKDKIFYWKDKGFFDYSLNPNYKMFISKNEQQNVWTNADTKEEVLSSNLRFYFYDFKEPQNFIFEINENIYEQKINSNKRIEFDIDSLSVTSLKITDNQGKKDYTTLFNEINRNLIYFEQ
jgi:hypothetical protein